MTKLPIYTPPTRDPRLGLGHRPSLPLNLEDMALRSRHLAEDPALREKIAPSCDWFGRIRTKPGDPDLTLADDERPPSTTATSLSKVAIAVKTDSSITAVGPMNTNIHGKIINLSVAIGFKPTYVESLQERGVSTSTLL